MGSDNTSPDRTCLIVFAKPPEEGRVKTRLSPTLTPREAADLYRCFLYDSLAQYDRFGRPARLYLSEGDVPNDLPEMAVETSIHRQEGDGLGSRMANAFLESFAAGFNASVIIGTDHPTLPDEFLQLAFDALAEPMQVVIGPSEDGGYYLLGMNHFFPVIFQDMEYSHPDVFGQTIERLLGTDAGITVLPAWYDVDTPEELERLQSHLLDDPKAAPRTTRFLEELSTRHSLSAGGSGD
ncbi:MAG: TIGR04282 family arsenosugar biosynthesis glycosyltransferase [Rhodothermia bacterium]|nr:TIGR04282 family arsenosugar biosynthesis glycosyltransferase [Rhodothermia bacterium]